MPQPLDKQKGVRGVQYVAIRYTERLAEAGAVASVGSKGDSYNNAMAEAFNSLFKAEIVRNRGLWKNIDDLEIAVAEYIDWFNFRRLHGGDRPRPTGRVRDHLQKPNPARAACSAGVRLHQTRYLTPSRIPPRLAGHVLIEQHDERDGAERRYFSEHSMTLFTVSEEEVAIPEIAAA